MSRKVRPHGTYAKYVVEHCHCDECRVANGVCPCCNRTFADLAAHMHGQHPEYGEGP